MNKHDIITLQCVIKPVIAKMGIVLLSVILITSMSIVVNYAWADDYTPVPSWTRQLSDWWSQGKISDVESVNAFQYLVDNKIINVPGLSFNHNVSFDKRIQQTKILSSLLWNESDKPVDFKSNTSVIRNSMTHSIYVQPAPVWAPYANNLIPSAINYWEGTGDVKFSYSSEPDTGAIMVKWLKEPDSKFVGYTVGRTAKIALGDSRCEGVWHPYDTDFITAILTHELGHTLGFGHSQNIGDIMYPVISGERYAALNQTFVLGPNGSAFVHVCTFSHTSTFHYTVKSSDTKNNLSVFFVPSKMEYAKFTRGEKFDYYKDVGCFGTTNISYDNNCSNVSDAGGLIISTPHNLLPKQNVTLTMEEE